MRKRLAFLFDECANIALAGGNIIRAAWERPRTVRHKGDIDLVTETDVEVQNFLQEKLHELLPEAAFIGEEGESQEMKSGLCWIVDPIDGTTNFVHRYAMVSSSIALWQDDQPLLGVVNAPMCGEIFRAATGLGAFCNKSPIHVSETAQLKEALVSTGFPYDIEPEIEHILARLERMLTKTQGMRRPGSAALDLACIAAGRFDIYYEYTLRPWDVAGGIAIVLEAGGKISNFENEPYKFGMPLLASNGLLHEAASSLLSDSCAIK